MAIHPVASLERHRTVRYQFLSVELAGLALRNRLLWRIGDTTLC